MLGLSTAEIAIALSVVTIGSILQGSIGFGTGLLAAPVLGLIDAAFVPVPIVIAVIPIGVGVAARDHYAVEWRQLGSAAIGRVPGVAAGAWIVSSMGARATATAIGAAVLLAVVGSITSRRFMPTPRNLMVAGFASGVTGTAAGIGGPPIALTYQHADPVTLRATMGAFFTIGAAMSLTALGIGGAITERTLRLSVLLLPATLTGLGLSRLVVRRLSGTMVRPVILVACTASALVLLVESFT